MAFLAWTHVPCSMWHDPVPARATASRALRRASTSRSSFTSASSLSITPNCRAISFLYAASFVPIRQDQGSLPY